VKMRGFFIRQDGNGGPAGAGCFRHGVA
jgi:hypothetical protein